MSNGNDRKGPGTDGKRTDDGGFRGRRVTTCSFCGKTSREVGPMVEGPNDVYICSNCTDLCQNIFKQETRRVRGARPQFGQIPSPRTIKEFLDQYVIGQDMAKRALAVAVHMAEVFGAPGEFAGHRACIRVQQHLVRVEAVAALGFPAAVRAVAIALAGGKAGHQAVEDRVLARHQRQPRGLARAAFIEQAQLHRACALREHRERHASVDHVRAKRGVGGGQQRGRGHAHAGSTTSVASGGRSSVSERA